MQVPIPNEQNEDGRPHVLVVGDWLVDEYWVTGIHGIPSSTGVGRTQVRALHPIDGCVQAIGAAGRIASVLAGAKSDNGPFCSVTGLGLWHPDDEALLSGIVEGKCTCFQNHHILSSGTPKDQPISLLSLATILPHEYFESTPPGTTRVIRIYHPSETTASLSHTVHWQLPISQLDIPQGALDASKAKLLRAGQHNSIVIADHGKGVISKSLIAELSVLGSKAEWYLCLQDWTPAWLASMGEATRKVVRAIVITKAAATLAIRARLVDGWIIKGQIFPDALKSLDAWAHQFPNAMIVVQPDHSNIIVREPGDNSDVKGLVYSDTFPNPISGMPQTSHFSGALIARIIDNPKRSFKATVAAVSFARESLEHEYDRLKDPNNWVPGKQPPLLVQKEVSDYKPFEWSEMRKKWRDAHSKWGVLSVKGKKEIQLWRSMMEVDGYACCVSQRRKVLQEFVAELKAFRSENERHHRSYLIIAEPGSGKTYLVKQVANMLGFRFHTANITQMITKADILDTFDTILTEQARYQSEPFLVFVDEINAELGKEPVYNLFLSPTESGMYVRGGKPFRLESCIWVFASTEALPTEFTDSHKPSKLPDFCSRLSADPFNLTISSKGELLEEARVEKVYQAVVMLCSAFPDVRLVSEKVLGVFHSLLPTLSCRDVERFVQYFHGIQFDEVTWKNIPEHRLKPLLDYPWKYEDLRNEDEGDMVEIKR